MSFSACLPGASRPRHCRGGEFRLAVRRLELAVGEQPLGADDLAVLEADGRLLEAVRAHGPQALIGHELAAVRVLGVAVHERVFLGLPVVALELVGDVALAGGAPASLQRLRDLGDDQASPAARCPAGPCSARSAASAARRSCWSGWPRRRWRRAASHARSRRSGSARYPRRRRTSRPGRWRP